MSCLTSPLKARDNLDVTLLTKDFLGVSKPIHLSDDSHRSRQSTTSDTLLRLDQLRPLVLIRKLFFRINANVIADCHGSMVVGFHLKVFFMYFFHELGLILTVDIPTANASAYTLSF